MIISIPVSVGELLDKISILQIKSQYTDSPFVIKEKDYLTQIAKENKIYDENFLNRLFEVNSKLWSIEDKLRKLEEKKVFGDEFVKNTRLVYITNDQRSRIKKEINEHTNSEMCEIKIYST